jgi:hypothetical protein
MCGYSLTANEKKIILNFKKSSKKECSYCGKEIINDEDFTVDHKLPVSRGGKTEEPNLCISCKKCNQEKSNLTDDEYMLIINQLNAKLQNDIAYKSLLNIYNGCNEVINTYASLCNQLSEYTKERNEIEIIIRETVCNASEGYMLFRDLKEVLIKMQDTQQQVASLISINELAKKQIIDIEKKMNSIRDNEYKKFKNSTMNVSININKAS